MIEQVTSMALTIAHHSGREAFGWEDLVEAMTTLEAGSGDRRRVRPDETRAVAIHEAGHAIAGHAYMTGRRVDPPLDPDARRLLGHHQALEKEERFSRFQTRDVRASSSGASARWPPSGSFYGENSNGVGGDVQAATARSACMVGARRDGPAAVRGRAAGRRDGGGGAQPRSSTASRRSASRS